MTRASRIYRVGVALAALMLLSSPAWTRWRQPNAEYAERRAKLRAQVDGPVVLFGYTGREDVSDVAAFFQEENFYYLTGHSEPGAALLIVPELPTSPSYTGPREILYLPPHNLREEHWEGPRLGPGDPGIAEKTGFAAVEPFAELESDLGQLSKLLPKLYTLLPGPQDRGYPHAANWLAWLKQKLPQADFADIAPRIGALRQIKSPGELALLQKAIELSVDAHLAAMKLARPGVWEYQVAAQMEEIHKYGGCEREGYTPIVGAGFNSTVLHYSALDSRIQDGDVVVLDTAGQYGGYSADISRTLPANGHFSPRQREIYEIVLGAQNAALAALKPGMTFARTGPNSLYRIAYDYINTHGKDREGQPLGRYFIHGLGHHIGLNVHDAGDPYRALEPGMVVTVEPGIYIPEEKLGVRIEDDALITETGYKLLTERLPREPDEIEKIMAAARK